MPDMYSTNFQQDGAPAHTAKITQNWLKKTSKTSGAKIFGPPTHLILAR